VINITTGRSFRGNIKLVTGNGASLMCVLLFSVKVTRVFKC